MLKKITPYLLLITVFTVLLAVLDQYLGIATQAYFWDELGVYAPAAIHFYTHGIGILPGDLPDILSRGHPTLFSVVVATSFKLFGCSPLTAHLTCYAIYVTGVCYLFAILRLWTTNTNAFIIAVAIGVQPCLISQSVIVLPEIMLMTAALAAAYHSMRRQLMAACIWLCIIVLVKESGLVIPLAIWLAYLYTNRSVKQSSPLPLIIIPYSVFALFLIAQKIQNGYFFFPLHTSLLKPEWYYIKERLLLARDFIINDQGRLWFLAIVLLPVLFSAFKWWQYLPEKFRAERRQWSMVLLIVAGGLAFTGLNFFLSRYIIFFLVFVYLGCFMLLLTLGNVHRLWVYVTSLYLIVSSVYINTVNTQYTDVDFTYVPHIKTSTEAFGYMATNPKFKDADLAIPFPLIAGTYGDKLGYPALKSKVRDFPGQHDTTFDYLVFCRPGNDNLLDSFKHHMVHDTTFRNKDAFVSIYKVKK